jgi:hypothetical protein
MISGSICNISAEFLDGASALPDERLRRLKRSSILWLELAAYGAGANLGWLADGTPDGGLAVVMDACSVMEREYELGALP